MFRPVAPRAFRALIPLYSSSSPSFSSSSPLSSVSFTSSSSFASLTSSNHSISRSFLTRPAVHYSTASSLRSISFPLARPSPYLPISLCYGDHRHCSPLQSLRQPVTSILQYSTAPSSDNKDEKGREGGRTQQANSKSAASAPPSNEGETSEESTTTPLQEGYSSFAPVDQGHGPLMAKTTIYASIIPLLIGGISVQLLF